MPSRLQKRDLEPVRVVVIALAQEGGDAILRGMLPYQNRAAQFPRAHIFISCTAKADADGEGQAGKANQ